MTESYTCQYCNKPFKKMSTFSVHVCEQKRRHLAKDEKHVIVAYNTFVRFYKIHQCKDLTKTYEEFCKSQYYNAFVKFGSFVHNIKPLYPDKFIDWILKSGHRLDDWCKDDLYEKYVLELIHTESVETALDRSINHMVAWGETNKTPWDYYFREVNLNRAIFDIKDGKISPWLILNCESGRQMLGSLRDDQLCSVAAIIDPVHWKKKFSIHKVDVAFVNQIVTDAKL